MPAPVSVVRVHPVTIKRVGLKIGEEARPEHERAVVEWFAEQRGEAAA